MRLRRSFSENGSLRIFEKIELLQEIFWSTWTSSLEWITGENHRRSSGDFLENNEFKLKIKIILIVGEMDCRWSIDVSTTVRHPHQAVTTPMKRAFQLICSQLKDDQYWERKHSLVVNHYHRIHSTQLHSSRKALRSIEIRLENAKAARQPDDKCDENWRHSKRMHFWVSSLMNSRLKNELKLAIV